MGPALLQSECKVKRNISKLQILRGVFAFFCVFNKKIARQHNACKQLLSGWEDSNFRPPRPERGALTNCATPRVGKPIAKLHQFFEIATIFCNFYFLIGDLFVELVFWDEGLLDAHGSAIMPAIFLLKRRCGFWRRFYPQLGNTWEEVREVHVEYILLIGMPTSNYLFFVMKIYYSAK